VAQLHERYIIIIIIIVVVVVIVIIITYTFWCNCTAIFRLIFEKVECKIDNAFN